MVNDQELRCVGTGDVVLGLPGMSNVSVAALVVDNDAELGEPKGLIPLMVIVQQNKSKVRPVLDFRELNGFIDVYTAKADVCSLKRRE